MEDLWIRGRWWGCLGDDVGNMTAALLGASKLRLFTLSRFLPACQTLWETRTTWVQGFRGKTFQSNDCVSLIK